MNKTNLKKRLIFVSWAIPLGWWVVNSTLNIFSLLPDTLVETLFNAQKIVILPGHICAITITFLAIFEYFKMLYRLFPKNGFWLVYIWMGLQIISYFVPDSILTMRQDSFILLITVTLEAFVWGKNTSRWKRASLLFSGTIFLLIACFSLLDFYDQPFQLIFASDNRHPMFSQLGIVTVLTSIFLCDAAAFFVGSIYGKHHFSSISPKKTVEGSIAGLVASIIVCVTGWFFFADPQYPLFLGLIMGILIGSFAQIGDLLVSLIKRYFKVKDSSNLIPGHGGILDRFDSLFFTAPIINLFLIITFKILN
ncbi:MAG: phosphatidate cytidylyltransferase [Chitinispirillia bacterium]|jgi:phosphatidate cytidylyltransferase